MVFFGPHEFSPVELNLAAPNKVFWVAAVVVIGFAILRLVMQHTAEFGRAHHRVTIFLYMVGAYAFAYICIHMGHNMERTAETNSVVMMLRWALFTGAVFLVLVPTLLLVPIGPFDFEAVCINACILCDGLFLLYCCESGIRGP